MALIGAVGELRYIFYFHQIKFAYLNIFIYICSIIIYDVYSWLLGHLRLRSPLFYASVFGFFEWIYVLYNRNIYRSSKYPSPSERSISNINTLSMKEFIQPKPGDYLSD